MSGRLFGAIEFLVVGIAAVTAVVVAVLLRQLDQADSRSSANSRPAGAGRRTGRVDLEVINRSRSRSPFCDCSTPLPEPEVSIRARAGRRQRFGARRLPSAHHPSRGARSRTHPDRRCRRTRARTQAAPHRHPGSADRPPADRSLPPIRVPAGDDPLLGEELRQSLGLSDEEFDGLRPYVPGDDLRKSTGQSARGDELQVRQFRPPRHGRLSVVIDRDPRRHRPCPRSHHVDRRLGRRFRARSRRCDAHRDDRRPLDPARVGQSAA